MQYKKQRTSAMSSHDKKTVALRQYRKAIRKNFKEPKQKASESQSPISVFMSWQAMSVDCLAWNSREEFSWQENNRELNAIHSQGKTCATDLSTYVPAALTAPHKIMLNDCLGCD